MLALHEFILKKHSSKSKVVALWEQSALMRSKTIILTLPKRCTYVRSRDERVTFFKIYTYLQLFQNLRKK